DMDQGFAASGRLGSKAYAKARGSAEDAYGRQLNDLANEVYGGAYQFDQGRKDQALGQLGALGQQSVDNRIAGAGLYQQGIGNLFSGVGAMPGVDAARYSDFDRLFQAGTTVQQQPWQSSRMGANIINSLQGGQTASTDPNPWGQIAGLAATALGAYMGASDRRLKQDIRRIGEMPSGLPLYRFRYVWGGPEQIGVMAQEAARLFPEAVHEIDGWLVVDYGRIG
ncbi:MAG: tail fiber domain-containing protein, partial [Ideonella sp.]|nr:tail fiber domain-containing protein [Ideonella sp.]